MESVDTVVIGAGVVGLAAARALALAGREVMVLEARETFGTEVSSRNSEVIHAGLYYPPGSLKARLCVRGREMLYAYCAKRGVGHRRCGKFIVAARESQFGELEAIRRRAEAAGVPDLQWLTRAQARLAEPALACAAALFSPATGIIDSHGLMLALLGDMENAGGLLATHTPVRSVEVRATAGGARFAVAVGAAGASRTVLAARQVVNAAGLDALALARRIRGLDAARLPPLPTRFARGCYFTLRGRAPFRHLVYPVVDPDSPTLGVHLTLDLGGQAKFGPDLEWIASADDLRVDPARAASFYAAVRTYWPGLPDGALQPGYAGIRPKITGPGEPAADFLIQGPAEHGVPGLVNLLGIESPGLTSCLAIGAEVARRLA